ncbi:O-antigen ligase [Desulfuromonas soudanensis]|uniref:O-antigen ligase n=2 Tax=Desulfuromonas soudanensis TaxID=1603606 RepID=A0A0M4D727_9BACT|nr:O-antigen ligase [Desulfuromonas soudanensis]
MTVPISNLYKLQHGAIWKAIKTDNFAFWMCCAYLFFEYIRPQAIWPLFDVYHYWARSFIMLAFIAWFFDPNRQFVWTKFTTGVFAYLVLVVISSRLAYWPEISSEYFMDFFNWVVVFFVLTQITTTRQRLYILLLIFMIASFKLSLYGARTFAMRGFAFADWGLAGPRGYFQNPGELAIQMLMFAPMSLFFIQGIKKHLKKWQVYTLYLMPITAVLTVIGTNTRGGQIALAAQVLALVMVSKHRFKMLIVICAIGFIGFQLLPEEQKTRFKSSGEDLTSVQRLLYWEHGWQMIKDHPFIGVGYFNFPAFYTNNHSEDIVLEMLKEKGAEFPHNIFIQVGTDTGFSGLAVFVGLMLGSFLTMHKLQKAAEKTGDNFVLNLTKGMNVALVGYIISGQFVTVAYYPFLWIHLVFVVSMTTFWKNEKSAEDIDNHSSRGMKVYGH